MFKRNKIFCSLFVLSLITFSACQVTYGQLVITESPIKLTYYQNEKLSLFGLEVKSDKGGYVTDYTTSPKEGDVLSNLGNVTVTISHEKYKSASFTVNVMLDPALKDRIIIDKKPDKTYYRQGEALDLTGLEVSCNGEKITDYVTDPVNGTILNDLGSIEITISKGNFTPTYLSVVVIENEDQRDKNDKEFTIYYMNDTHGAFIRQDNESNYQEAGISYISSYVKDKMTVNPNCILLSGGDMFQGGFESNYTRGEIMVDAMNEMGFDAMVLGNHEFDWGEEALINIADKLDCPILAANTFYSSDKTTRPEYLEPYTVLNCNELRIGVIGAQQENMGEEITGSVSSHFYFPDPIPYIKQYSDFLKTNLACDLVIVGFHDGGFDNNDAFKYTSLTEVSDVSHEKYVDAIYLAHDHRQKQGEVNNVPYIESQCNGRKLGRSKFVATYDGYDFDVKSYNQTNISTYTNCTVKDPAIDALVDKYSGVMPDPDVVIATLTKSYTRAEFVEVICQAMYWYVNENASIFGGRIYLATHNTTGIRVTTIPSGELTRRKLITYLPFDNCLYIQKSSQNQINYMINSSYYTHYLNDDPVYVGGYTRAVTISYIAESETYAKYCQVSCTGYPDYIVRDVLAEYLQNGLEA